MIRVLLAEDQHIIREALAALLGLEEDIEVVATVDSGTAAVDAARVYQPDIAVLDIDMPGTMDGLEAAAVVREKVPGCRVLMLTAYGKPGHLRRALGARVDGFVLKTAPPDDLVSAIRKVAVGERVLDASLAVTAWDLADNPLTPREVEVLRLVAQGAEATEIAAQVHLTAGTVRNYLTAIVTKLNARNRTDAVRIATEAGWI
ncbi:DNA-binding response regulator [Streptomyces sp. NPDC059679]|uniref:response regulator transcription factor n=1 Tax=unclassified Streptomyces TaxID=2593676 RepID=UPI000B7D1EEF|nr:response regulator transcription factor [Streptomyces sp. NBS 14/10]KAK1181101.1 response regulator transcription factor [Streptomyces sp. NBS 14/10]MDW6061822.1 response regulator transcription factor [Streptomyces sp. FXJ1.4098]NUP36057.1 response regulator transcription factor [Streptomyces sp.]NUS82165.1 response regulator transcription factor [Streptomyces sp.]